MSIAFHFSNFQKKCSKMQMPFLECEQKSALKDWKISKISESLGTSSMRGIHSGEEM